MNPTDLLFQTFSSLFAGVTTDITTALVGMVALMVLVFGGTKLIGIFNEYQHGSSNNEDDAEASSIFSRRNHHDEE